MKLNKLIFVTLCSILCACGDSVESIPQMSEGQIQQLRVDSEAYANLNIEELRADTEAMLLGEQLLTAHCAACHGADDGSGHGTRLNEKKGVASLISGEYDYGSSAEAISMTINQGRQSTMPVLGNTLGEVDLGILVAYVKSFSSAELDPVYRDKALALYEQNCFSCHGDKGLGNPDLGIPNLSDEYWQHGDSQMSIRLNITRGVESQCPAQEEKLSTTEIKLLTAFILQRRESIL